jgi:hypothetical protein
MSMGTLSKLLTDRLLQKGFTPVEIPELLNDLTLLIHQSKSCTTNYINKELENLGWGIQIIDESLFQEIISLLVSTDEIAEQY